MSAHVPVLVVGAGPTGLLLAAELHRRGVAARLIDDHDTPLPWDRATVVHPRTLELMETLGLADAFLAAGVRQRVARLYSGDEILGEIDLAECGSRFPFNLGMSEQLTEEILGGHLERHGGTVDRGCRLVGLEQPGDGPAVTTIDRHGATETLTADWVVGCDGLHSLTRASARIALTGHDIEEPWAVVDLSLAGWDGGFEVNHVFLDELPVILTALPGERFRAYVRPSAPDSDLVADALATIRRHLPDVAVAAAVDPHRFHCHTRVAERYRAGRVLLAGDAAHVCSPSQGHGMNSGIQDALNLAWKIALVLGGHSDPALLDSYEAERRPVAQHITTAGDDADIALLLRDPAARRERDAVLRTTFADPTMRHHEVVAEAELDIDYDDSPIVTGAAAAALRPGERVPDALAVPLVARGDGRGHVAVLLGPADPERLAAVEAAADPVFVEATVRLDAADVAEPTLVVVRPDHHIGLVAGRDHGAALRRYQELLAAGE